jgi:hypothetical protein
MGLAVRQDVCQKLGSLYTFEAVGIYADENWVGDGVRSIRTGIAVL